MVDNVGGAGGGEAFLASLLQKAANAQQAQQADADADAKRSDDVTRNLVKKHEQKQQLETAQRKSVEVKESFSAERGVESRWRDVAMGKAGPELMQFANKSELQGKLTGKLKEMVLEAAATDPGRAADAAAALSRLVDTQTFVQVAPTARDVSEIAAKVLENPRIEAQIREALDHPFARMPEGDAGSKQALARFASRQTDVDAMGKGVGVRMGADMLGTLAGAKVPGFAQRASMQMVERNPSNAEGMKNVDAFVKEPAVKAMPQMARGYATQVLAKGDGDARLKTNLTEVAKNDNFRAMGREEKGRLFATVGQGRASELRAITDKTLLALQMKDFPRQAQQVESFLGELGRQMLRGSRGAGRAAQGEGARAGALGSSAAGGTAEGIDPTELVAVARRGGMPAKPNLKTLTGLDQEAADAARVQNRASLQAYFGKLSRHYDQIDQKIAGAQYFEDVNMLGGLKEADAADLSALDVRDEVAAKLDQQLAGLKSQLDGRQLSRAAYFKQLKAVQADAFAGGDLTLDEKTYAYAKTSQAHAAQTFQELSGKKHRKLREVKNKLMPADKRRARLEGRRPTGVQPRYFRAGGVAEASAATGGAPSATAPARAAGAGQAGQRAQVGSANGAGAPPAPATAAGTAGAPSGAVAATLATGLRGTATLPQARRANAAPGTGERARPRAYEKTGGQPRAAARAGGGQARGLQAKDILARLDPSLTPAERMQQAQELMAQTIQQQAMQMASELMASILAQENGGLPMAVGAGQQQTAAVADAGVGSGTAAARATVSGKRNYYGVPQSFERDLGAGHNVRPVRAANDRASEAADAGEDAAPARLGKALMKDNASLRPLATLYGLKMVEMSKLESNALRNLGWDAISWGAKDQPGASIPTTYRTPYNKLRPLQRDSVRALGLDADAWNEAVRRNGGDVE